MEQNFLGYYIRLFNKYESFDFLKAFVAVLSLKLKYYFSFLENHTVMLTILCRDLPVPVLSNTAPLASLLRPLNSIAVL